MKIDFNKDELALLVTALSSSVAVALRASRAAPDDLIKAAFIKRADVFSGLITKLNQHSLPGVV